MLTGIDAFERERVENIYSRRNYDDDYNYSDINPAYLHRVQSLERATLAALEMTTIHGKLSKIRILDFGCGNGKWFGRWLAWGASPDNLFGVDLRNNAINKARDSFPGITFQTMSNGLIPYPNDSFDVVFQNLVFSSILDNNIRQFAASEMMRVLKPGGVVFWFDFSYNNPANSEVKAVTKKDIKLLFSSFKIVGINKIILAPPLAKIIVPISWTASVILEAVLPILRTHIFAIIKKINSI
jgi:SAM-dependent methyltransferase